MAQSRTFTRALLGSAFLMNVGGAAVTTYLVIYLSLSLHFNAWQVGTVLTANIFCQRILPIVTGSIGDTVGHHIMIVLGFLVRGSGFLGYAMFHSFIALVLCSGLVGFGGALYTPAMSAVFALQNDKRLFTLYNQVLNGGFIVGPIVGGILVKLNQNYLFLCGAFISVMIGLWLMFFRLQPHAVTENPTSQKPHVIDNFVNLLKNKRFVSFMVWMVLFWTVWQQFFVSLPIRAYQISGNASYISQLYSASGIIGLFLMLLLRKQFEIRNSALLVRTGFLFVSLGLALIPLFNNEIWIVLCVLIFMIGETLVLPAKDIIVAEIGESKAMGAYYGVSNLVNGIGGILGSYMGSLFMQLGGRDVWPWLVYGGIGATATIFLRHHALSREPALQIDNKTHAF